MFDDPEPTPAQAWISKRLKLELVRRNIDVPALAQLAGLSDTTCRKLIRGILQPRLDTLERISDRLEWNLFNDSPTLKPAPPAQMSLDDMVAEAQAAIGIDAIHIDIQFTKRGE